MTVGALVTANQADSLVTVQRLDPIYVDLTQSVQDFLRMKEEVASVQIKQVQGSTPVQLNLENGKRYSQTGTLKFSDPTVDETTGSVTLRAIFPNPNGDLLPGMYVTALVDEGSRQNVLLVPQEGVTHNAQGKATALILDKDDVVQLREIEASKAIGDQWVVTSGLQAGDRVIVSGLQRIRPGIKARAISSSQENASRSQQSHRRPVGCHLWLAGWRSGDRFRFATHSSGYQSTSNFLQPGKRPHRIETIKLQA